MARGSAVCLGNVTSQQVAHCVQMSFNIWDQEGSCGHTAWFVCNTKCHTKCVCHSAHRYMCQCELPMFEAVCSQLSPCIILRQAGRPAPAHPSLCISQCRPSEPPWCIPACNLAWHAQVRKQQQEAKQRSRCTTCHHMRHRTMCAPSSKRAGPMYPLSPRSTHMLLLPCKLAPRAVALPRVRTMHR